MALVGRDQDLRHLGTSHARVVIVAGDSGIGKSEVLRVAQEESSANAIAPPPVGLRNAPGALQRGLLEALGAAVAEVAADQTTAERVGDLLAETARRVVDLRVKELAAGVGRHLLGIVSNRVSPELADTIKTFAQQLVTTRDSELDARITNAGDPDVVDLVCQFASEARTFAGGRSIVLALDDGEQIDEGDRRRLADLASVLPEGVVVRVAYSTWNSESRDQVDELNQLGVESLELESLGVEAIGEWLESIGLPTEWAEEVRRRTNGYAMHVSEAINVLQAEGSIAALDGIEPSNAIAVTTRRIWRTLGNAEKVIVERLCVFPDPLSSEDAAAYLNIDVDVWRTLQRILFDARVFTGEPAWFHELRRQMIVAELIVDPDWDQVLRRAIEFREAQMELATPPPEAFVQYAQLTAQRPFVAEENPVAASVLAADRNEVAIAASLIELYEPSTPAISGDVALLYARQVFGATGDLVAALERIAERGFVQVASNPQATVLVGIWGTVEVLRLFAGRAADELGRLPTPQLATAVFGAELRPQMDTFRSAIYGIGSPRMSELSGHAAQLQRVQVDGSIVIGTYGPNLLLRLRFGVLSLYAAVAYNDPTERDGALARLSGFTTTRGDQILSVVDCVADPTFAVRSLRFYRAAERVTGKSFLGNAVGSPPHPPKLDSPISLGEEMEQRAATLEAMRQLCLPEERYAFSLEDPIGYAYRGTLQDREAAQIIGRGSVTPLPIDAPPISTNPLFRFQLARQADLGPNERIGFVTWNVNSEQDDPIVHEIHWAFEQAAKFNQHQRSVSIPLEVEELQARLAASSAQATSDALAIMAATGTDMSGEEMVSRGLQGSVTYAVIHLGDPSFDVVPAATSTATVPNDSGLHTAQVQVLPAQPGGPRQGRSFADARVEFAKRFGIEAETLRTVTYGDIGSLAVLLGYRVSDVNFDYVQ